jgi:hypothetical protein
VKNLKSWRKTHSTNCRPQRECKQLTMHASFPPPPIVQQNVPRWRHQIEDYSVKASLQPKSEFQSCLLWYINKWIRKNNLGFGFQSFKCMYLSPVTSYVFRCLLRRLQLDHCVTCSESTCFLVIKPTRFTNFSNLFWNETLNVSDSSSLHHQEFFHCDPARKLSTNLYDIYHRWVYSE